MADRPGRAGLRARPDRLADPLGDRRLADGPGDGPARTPAHRLDRPGLRRRAAALLRRAPVRAVAAGAARHLRRVLHPLRDPLRRRRPRLVPRPARPAHPGAGDLGIRPGARAAVATVAGARRRLLRPRRRHQVERALRAGRLRHPGLGLERGRPPVVRGPVVDRSGRRSSTAYRPSSTSCSSASSSTSRPGPAGWSTPRSTSRRSPTPSTRSTTAASRGRPRRSRTPPGWAR